MRDTLSSWCTLAHRASSILDYVLRNNKSNINQYRWFLEFVMYFTDDSSSSWYVDDSSSSQYFNDTYIHTRTRTSYDLRHDTLSSWHQRRFLEFVIFRWQIYSHTHMHRTRPWNAVCCSVLGSCCSVLQWPCCVGCLSYIHMHTHTQRPQAWQHRSSRPWKLCWALRSACIGTLL